MIDVPILWWLDWIHEIGDKPEFLLRGLKQKQKVKEEKFVVSPSYNCDGRITCAMANVGEFTVWIGFKLHLTNLYGVYTQHPLYTYS